MIFSNLKWARGKWSLWVSRKAWLGRIVVSQGKLFVCCALMYYEEWGVRCEVRGVLLDSAVPLVSACSLRWERWGSGLLAVMRRCRPRCETGWRTAPGTWTLSGAGRKTSPHWPSARLWRVRHSWRSAIPTVTSWTLRCVTSRELLHHNNQNINLYLMDWQIIIYFHH